MTPETGQETLAACLTPPGQGALATLAVDGPRAWELVRPLFRTRSGAEAPAEPRWRIRHADTLSNLATAQEAFYADSSKYATTYGTGFSTSLTALGPPASGQSVTSTAAGLVDDTLAAGYKSVYSFFYTPTDYHAATNKKRNSCSPY